MNTPQANKQLDNVFESRKFSLESGKNENKLSLGFTQISNKIILKSNSHSNNNQDPTSIIDNLKSEKLKIITASKYAPNLMINLNQFPSASKNDQIDFSRKSSPHNRICSDIPNSHLNLKNIAKNSILSNQSVGLKINENSSRKFQISTNVAIPIFCRKKTDIQKEPVLESEFKKQSSETNNKFVATLNQLKNNILINKKHATTTNSPKNKITNIKPTAINNNFIQPKQAPTNSTPVTQRVKEEAKTKSVISTKINLNDIKQKNQDKNTKTECNIIENSLENILETSNCSVISTARESNYYCKESEKLCKYIKNCKFNVI